MNKIILCTDSKNGIGKGGTIPWHSTEDFKHFKNETLGKKVLMGYKTWESLPFKPLRDRVNIIVTTRHVPDDELKKHKDVIFIHINNLQDFLRYNDDVIVIGGSTIYNAALPFVDEIILSKIDGDYECDTFFDVHASQQHIFVPSASKVLDDGIIVFYMHRTDDSFKNACETVRWI